MATYTRNEILSRRVEYSVPTGPLGACWSEVTNALNAARCELSQAIKLPPFAIPSDDQIRVRAGDDSIVIAFELPSSKLERSA